MASSISLTKIRAGFYESPCGVYVAYSYKADDGSGTWWNVCRYETDLYYPEAPRHLVGTGEAFGTLGEARDYIAWAIARDEDGPDDERLYR